MVWKPWPKEFHKGTNKTKAMVLYRAHNNQSKDFVRPSGTGLLLFSRIPYIGWHIHLELCAQMSY
jgi:hypothetical protein